MGQVLDVWISHLRSLPGASSSRPICVPRGGRCNHITFVQLRTASLAWAPFNAGCDELGPDTNVVGKAIRSSW